MKKFLSWAMIPIVVLYFYGCASIVHGSSTKININSNPPGATAVVGGQTIVTPSTVILKNDQQYTIVLSKEGYQDTYFTVDKKMSGWVWGNIVFGGIIGLVVDSMSGAAFKLEPTEVNVTLVQ